MLSIVSDLPSSDQQALAILCVASVMCLRLADQRQAGRAWLVWTAALLAVTLPLADFVPRPNWQHVGLVPFCSPPIKLSDIAANIVLYAPFGWIATKSMTRSGLTAIATAGAAAFALSVSAETAQLFSLYRYPSTTDVVCNVAGAALGATVAILTARAAAPYIAAATRRAEAMCTVARTSEA